jgi:hypothetical protein
MFIQHLSRSLIVATACCISIPHVNAAAYRFVNISKIGTKYAVSPVLKHPAVRKTKAAGGRLIFQLQ